MDMHACSFAIATMYWHDISFDVFSEQTVSRGLS